MSNKVNFENVIEFAEIGDYAVKFALEKGMNFIIFAAERTSQEKPASPGFLRFGMEPKMFAEMVKAVLSEMSPAGVAQFMLIFSDPKKYHRPADGR